MATGGLVLVSSRYVIPNNVSASALLAHPNLAISPLPPVPSITENFAGGAVVPIPILEPFSNITELFTTVDVPLNFAM